MTPIQFDDPRAIALREWLLENIRLYVQHPSLLNREALSAWLYIAEHNEGVVEIGASSSVTGHTITYRVPLDLK